MRTAERLGYFMCRSNFEVYIFEQEQAIFEPEGCRVEIARSVIEPS